MRKKLSPIVVVLLVLTMIGQALTVSASTSSEIIQTAKKYIGVPYVYGGTSTSGFDCSGYMQFVFKQHGVDLPRTTSAMYQTGTSVSRSELKAGDLVFFNTFGYGVSHAGIYIGNGKFIHASTSRGVVIDSLYSNYYKPRYLGAKRVLEEEPEIEQVSQKEEAERQLGPNEYMDVPTSHWAYDEIKTLSAEEIISGMGQKQYGVEKNLTRAQVAALIVRSKGMSVNQAESNFEDVPKDSWYYKPVSIAEQFGLFDHISGDELNPDEQVTRAEIALMIANAFKLKVTDAEGFADVKSSNPAYQEILALQSNDIITGYDDGTFRPNDTITRAEFAIVLYEVVN